GGREPDEAEDEEQGGARAGASRQSAPRHGAEAPWRSLKRWILPAANSCSISWRLVAPLFMSDMITSS
ncbi:MAG: hypothetical protein L0322_28210, partial [Chloroflexi bacterium]|nr:hypothetical protein [Chloroflexota bacterium]